MYCAFIHYRLNCVLYSKNLTLYFHGILNIKQQLPEMPPKVSKFDLNQAFKVEIRSDKPLTFCPQFDHTKSQLEWFMLGN